MRLSVPTKLFLALFTTVGVVVIAVIATVQWSISTGFTRHIAQLELDLSLIHI